MAYPNYPRNRVIVNGVDLTEKFKMVLVDGYTLSPPPPKTYIVDIPGGNGKLDLTESLLGDTAYDNRKQEFTFYVIKTSDFERVKTDVSALLHGKAYNYTLTMDPGYIYHGRFSVTSYEHTVHDLGVVGCIKIEIDTDPFKRKVKQVYKVSALAGRLFTFPSGRKRVRPTIESGGYLKVIFNGKLHILYQGTWDLNDILFTEGNNELYLNSYEVRIVTWNDLNSNGVTWGEFGRRRLFEWYKSKGSQNPVVKVWADMENVTWEEVAGTTWADHAYKPEVTDQIKDIYIKYDWSDL